MKFESFLLELLGFVAVGGSAALLTQVISITPYNMELSKAQNNAYFVAIPLLIYVAYRVYFGLSFYLTSFLPKQLKAAEWSISTLLVSGGLGAGLYAPTVQSTLKDLFDYYAGDLHKILYKASEPELKKAYQFGFRVITLIAAWFVALFVVELLIRAVLFGLVFSLRAVGVLPKLKKEEIESKEMQEEKDAATESD